MSEKRTLWFDLTNTSHVHFFHPFIDELKDDFKIIVTTRDLAETRALLNGLNTEYQNFGEYSGDNKLLKISGHFLRGLKMLPFLKEVDFAFSHGSPCPIMVKYIKNAKLISSYDNEHAMSFDLFSKHSDAFIVPEVLGALSRDNASNGTKVMTYPGLKEQIYLADFKPDERFTDKIPFDDYLVLRAEAWKSDYVKNGVVRAFDIARRLVKEGHNIVFLPRYGMSPSWMKRSKNVFVSPPVNGPQLCWFSKGVLTGSGTLAREAAVLGVPSVSFYSCEPLKVDLFLESNGMVLRSRDSDEIVKYLEDAVKGEGLLKEAHKVRQSILNDVKNLISE